MAEKKRFFDVWFVQSNTVYKEVPFQVVTDWVQQSRLTPEDMLRPSGTAEWFKVGGMPLFSAYIPQELPHVDDAAEALQPVEFDVPWKKRHDDEDDDVDMIPLIDISLVLLIFFMMTTTVSAISRVSVAEMRNAFVPNATAEKVRLEIDRSPSGEPLYSLARGEQGIRTEDANLPSQEAVMSRLNDILKEQAKPVAVHIAVDKRLPYGVTRQLRMALEQLQRQGVGITIIQREVNEAPKR